MRKIPYDNLYGIIYFSIKELYCSVNIQQKYNNMGNKKWAGFGV